MNIKRNTYILIVTKGGFNYLNEPLVFFIKSSINESLQVLLFSCSVVSNLLLHGLQPTRLLCPWDFPGKDTGVGGHLPLQGSFHIANSKRKPKNCNCCQDFGAEEVSNLLMESFLNHLDTRGCHTPSTTTLPTHSRCYFNVSMVLTEFLLIPVFQKILGCRLLATTYLNISQWGRAG